MDPSRSETPIPITCQFAPLFDGVDPEIAAVVEQTLASHRLDGMIVTRDAVADLIDYATGAIEQDEYDRRAAERAARAR